MLTCYCLQSCHSRWTEGGIDRKRQCTRRSRNKPYSVLGIQSGLYWALRRVWGHWTIGTDSATAQWLSTSCRQQIAMIEDVMLSDWLWYANSNATIQYRHRPREAFVFIIVHNMGLLCWKRIDLDFLSFKSKNTLVSRVFWEKT